MTTAWRCGPRTCRTSTTRSRTTPSAVTLLANNIVSYGGRDINITDNVVADTLTNGGGIHVANRYPGVNAGAGTAVAGTFTLARNTLIRAGNSDFNWQFGVGAIWFDALNGPITGATINVTDTDILDSSYAAIHFIEGNTSGVNFNNVNIERAGTYALQIQAPGSASFTNVRATGIAQSNPIHNCVGPSFQITQGAGNSGWYTATPFCGPWPAPIWHTDPTTPTTPPTTAPPPRHPRPPHRRRPLPRPRRRRTRTPTWRGAGRSPRPATWTSTAPATASTATPARYWESANNAFPQSLTVDLGAATTVSRVVLKLPPAAAWGTRTQTLCVLGSTNGSTYSTVKPSAGVHVQPGVRQHRDDHLPRHQPALPAADLHR